MCDDSTKSGNACEIMLSVAEGDSQQHFPDEAPDIGAYAVLCQPSAQKPGGSNLTTGLPADGPAPKECTRDAEPESQIQVTHC